MVHEIKPMAVTSIFRLPYALLRPLYEKTSFHRSVIDDLPSEALQAAYAHCREITRVHAKTFYMATRFLPNEKQRGIFAIYALCRFIDDLVDEAEDLIHQKKISLSEVQEKLHWCKQKLISIYNGHTADDPIFMAFSDTMRKYDISIELPLLLMEGVILDLTKSRFGYFSEVYDYSYKVASVVGLMTSQVFGYENEEALKYAVDLGIAMQLTNILRDVGEDLEKDRIYLPANELRMFGLTEQDLWDKKLDDRFRAFMKFQIKRARHYYERADKGIVLLSKDSRLPVYLARHNYCRILDKIEENDYNIYNWRAYLSYSEKLAILPKVFYELKTAS